MQGVSYISGVWKIMVKGTYQLPPHTRIEFLHVNNWWSIGLEPIEHGFTYTKCKHNPISLSNVCMAILTWVSWSNIIFGNASKLGEHGDMPLLSYTNFMAWRLDIWFFHWKKTLFGEKIPQHFVNNNKIWCLLCGITIWTIWIEYNDKVINQEQWHQSKVKHLIWVDLIICTPKWLGRGYWNLSRLVTTQPI